MIFAGYIQELINYLNYTNESEQYCYMQIYEIMLIILTIFYKI
jgi:hypothetical protein